MRNVFIILFVVGISTFQFNICKAQPPENYLKLSRIVAIDSVKSVTVPVSFSDFYTVTVPNDVYWKVTYISFSSALTLTSYNPLMIKINNSYLPFMSASGSLGIEKNTSFWVKPNSVIYFQVRNNNMAGITLNLGMYLSAEEYVVGQ